MRLFGEVTYTNLTLSDAYALRLGILVGANGTGKTSLLRLIRAALSHDPTLLKQQIYALEFESFQIELNNGLRARFFRKKTRTGSFEYELTAPNGKVLKITLNPERVHWEYSLMLGAPDQTNTVAEMRQILSQHAPTVAYLSTNRDAGARASTTTGRVEEDPLQESVTQFLRRVQLRARRDTNDAEVAAYDVLFRTAENALRGKHPPQSRDELLLLFREQMDRIAEYANYGLITKINADPLIQRISQVPERQFEALSSMLVPYLESQRARLDSVKDTYDFITQFTASMNMFLRPKSVRLNLLEPFAVLKHGDVLPLRSLSSGERQLLWLFTSSCGYTRRDHLVLIDEPELSLNSNWTQLLVRHLLSPILTRSTQFIFATHSIEFLGQYPDAVLDLSS